MDRNSAIGLTLIALLLLVYFYFFSPAPVPPESKQVTTEAAPTQKDSVQKKPSGPTIDSTLAKQYGNLSTFLTGKEEFTTSENSDLKLTFSSHGTLREVNLKNFKTYSQQPLFLAKDGNNSFSLMATYEGRTIDLYQLHYQPEVFKKGDTTIVSFTAKLAENSFLKHVYSIPAKGYQISYRIESQGTALQGKNINFAWVDFIPLVEKDINDSR